MTLQNIQSLLHRYSSTSSGAIEVHNVIVAYTQMDPKLPSEEVLEAFR